MQQKNIVIVGAGLVGSLLAIYLAKRGYNVKIFERRPDMRKTKVKAGRSINLALSDRGFLALEKVGLVDEVRKISIPMHGRYIHNLNGSTAFQPYGKEGQYINSVSRAMLNMKLVDLAEQQGIDIFFHEKCVAIDWSSNRVEFKNTATFQKTGIKADIFLEPMAHFLQRVYSINYILTGLSIINFILTGVTKSYRYCLIQMVNLQ